MEKHAVRLTPKERERLKVIVSKGRNKATYIQRAHVLLKSAEGKTDSEISQWLYMSEQTIRRTRVRFCEDGLETPWRIKTTRNGKAHSMSANRRT
jgi:hypothetical protein